MARKKHTSRPVRGVTVHGWHPTYLREDHVGEDGPGRGELGRQALGLHLHPHNRPCQLPALHKERDGFLSVSPSAHRWVQRVLAQHFRSHLDDEGDECLVQVLLELGVVLPGGDGEDAVQGAADHADRPGRDEEQSGKMMSSEAYDVRKRLERAASLTRCHTAAIDSKMYDFSCCLPFGLRAGGVGDGVEADDV